MARSAVATASLAALSALLAACLPVVEPLLFVPHRLLAATCPGSHGGDGTYYNQEGQKTSCGTTFHASELTVALNAPDMANGANPNDNPKCGQKILACGDKGSATLTITNTCPECASGSLDMSPTAFQAVVGDLSIGRSKVTWTYL